MINYVSKSIDDEIGSFIDETTPELGRKQATVRLRQLLARKTSRLMAMCINQKSKEALVDEMLEKSSKRRSVACQIEPSMVDKGQVTCEPICRDFELQTVQVKSTMPRPVWRY